MKKTNTTVSLLLAGLMAAAGVAQAQGISAGADVGVILNTPGVTGSVDVNTGTTTEVFVPVSRKDEIRQEAQGQGRASGTMSGPKTGEASTMVQGRPNAEPNDPLVTRSRAELRAEREMKKAKRRAASQISIMGHQSGSVGAMGAATDTSVGVEAGPTK